MTTDISYIGQEVSRLIDEDLLGPMGYTNDQLMELAGQSVAMVIHAEVPPCKVLVICGPGNNGGDGLISARHLKHFGFDPVICYPKQPQRAPFPGLLTQCKGMEIPIVESLPSDLKEFKLIVDAIFGYSFQGAIRAPFDSIIATLRDCPVPVASVDIPSGWDVEAGDVNNVGVKPTILISLAAPKLGVKAFTGTHYLGGRFMVPSLAKKFNMTLAQFPGSSPVCKL